MSTAPTTFPGHSIQQRLISILACVILAGGIATIGVAAYMVVLDYSRLPWADGWIQIFIAARGENPFSLRWLWQLHNEHRLLIPKFFLAADLRWFAAQQKLLLAIIFAVQLLHCCLLSWSARVLGGWRGPLWRTATGLAAFSLFCPTQWENLVSGFQTCFVLPPLLATLSFVGLLLYCRALPAGQWKFIVLSVTAACAAVCCLANGLLLPPLLALAAVALRLRWSVVLTYATTAVVSVVLYFHHYLQPPQSSDPLLALRSPGKLIGYIASYFGSSWTVGHTWDGHNLQSAPYWGLFGFVMLLVLLWPLRKRIEQHDAFSIQLLLLALFCLGTALITATGRVTSGNEQAFASRYQTIAVLFWWVLACLLLAACKRSGEWTVLAVQALFLVVFLRGATLVHLPLRDAREHAFQMRAAAAALLTDVPDPGQIAEAFPDPNYVFSVVPFMREKRLSAFAAPAPAELGAPVDSAFRLVDGRQCEGAVQAVVGVPKGNAGDLRIAGWAWDRQSRRPATEVVTASDGRITGFGALGDWRPMVRAVHREMNTSFVGFTAYAKSPPGPVSVYAVLAGDPGSACLIGTAQP